MNEKVDELRAFAHQVFEDQPFTRYIDAKLTSVGPGTAEIRLSCCFRGSSGGLLVG